MLASCTNGKTRYVRSKLLDERLSMAKRGLKGLYKAIIFDLAGSLVNINNYGEYEKLNKIVRQTLEKRAILPVEFENELDLDLMRVGLPKLFKLNIEELENQLIEDCTLLRDAKIYTVIKNLKKHGFKVALLANNDVWAKSKSQSILEESQNLEIPDTDMQTTSRKSQAEIYDVMLGKLQVQSTECIFVDNLLSNLKNAERLGITSIHIDNRDSSEAIRQLEALLNLDLH